MDSPMDMHSTMHPHKALPNDLMMKHGGPVSINTNHPTLR